MNSSVFFLFFKFILYLLHISFFIFEKLVLRKFSFIFLSLQKLLISKYSSLIFGKNELFDLFSYEFIDEL